MGKAKLNNAVQISYSFVNRQPLDLLFNAIFKGHYHRLLPAFLRSTDDISQFKVPNLVGQILSVHMQKSLAAIGSFKKSGIYSSSGYAVPDDAVWKGLQKWASEEKIQELRDELKEVY